MQVYLVQHGEAKSEAEDPERSLTEQGEATVHRVATWAVRAGITVDQIRHSGKKRAAQTAAILAAALKPPQGAVAVSGLNPNDDISSVAEILDTESTAIMLVGHLPFLNRLASLLAAGDPERDIIRFQNAGIVCLSRQDGKWSIRWAVPPELLGAAAVGDQPSKQ